VEYGQKSPAANDGQTLFKAAGAIVLGAKHNEWHKGAEKIKWKRQISQKLCGQMESCKITMSQGRGASIGDRLVLDDSAIDWHTKMEISAKG